MMLMTVDPYVNRAPAGSHVGVYQLSWRVPNLLSTGLEPQWHSRALGGPIAIREMILISKSNADLSTRGVSGVYRGESGHRR